MRKQRKRDDCKTGQKAIAKASAMDKKGTARRWRKKRKGAVANREVKKVGLKEKRGEERERERKKKRRTVSNLTSHLNRMHTNWFPFMDMSPQVDRISRAVCLWSHTHQKALSSFWGWSFTNSADVEGSIAYWDGHDQGFHRSLSVLCMTNSISPATFSLLLW